MHYALFYPEEMRYSKPLYYQQARFLSMQFPSALLVNLRTGEVLN